MADPAKNEVYYLYYAAPKRQLTSATWFTKEEKNSKEYLLIPMSTADAALVEELYQRAVLATSSLGKGLQTVIDEQVVLTDEAYKISILKNASNILTMKKKPTGWFGTNFDLQRGYGEYFIPGEEEEMALGPVSHLVFVIHGVGEALWSRQDIKVNSIVEEMNKMRMLLQRKQVTDWKKECERATKAGESEPPVPGRIELIPIEWYDQIHSSSNSLMKSLKATTLRSIPSLRAIANDVVFDVLMYLTPTFCESVLENVTQQIDTLFHQYQELHPEFLPNGGKCCLMGHSLGSVICWDLLSILKDFSEPKPKRADESSNGNGLTSPMACSTGVSIPSQHAMGYQAYATQNEHANVAENGTWGPSLTKKMKPIPFFPDFTIFLGSPLGLFLTLRGAHPVFDELRVAAVQEAQEKAVEVAEAKADCADTEETSVSLPLASPFTLPSGAIYNIFHPSDPVAYRIEPLLLSQETKDTELPSPLYLVKEGQSVRLHVKALQVGDTIRRSLLAQSNNWSSMISQVTEQLVLSSAAAEAEEARHKSKVSLRPGPVMFPLGGRSERVDFQLQPGVIDNQYLSAVMAHSTYFENADVLEFLLDLCVEKEHVRDTKTVVGDPKLLLALE